MTIRVYSHEDEGAPVLPNVSSQRLIDNLRIILKTCLVDGYGDKPGAGWTLGHDLPDGFSLGNGAGWVNVFIGPGSSGAVNVFVIEEITDFSTPEVEGVNKRSAYVSDTYPNIMMMRPSMPGFSGMHNGGAFWTVIADERTVTIMAAGFGNVSQHTVDPGSNYSFLWHFGEYITPSETPGFIAMCGARTSGLNGTSGAYWTGSGTTVLRNPFTGLVDQGATPDYYASIPKVGPLSNIAHQIDVQPLGRLSFDRVGLCANNLPGLSNSPTYPIAAGTLRGVLASPQISGAFSEKILHTYFGIEAPKLEDKFRELPNILGPEHPGLYIAYPNTADLGAFISLDPADWE